MELSRDWVERLRVWNDSHSQHPPVLIRWDEKAIKTRTFKVVFGVSIPRWQCEGRWEVGVVLKDQVPGMEACCTLMDGGLWFFGLFHWMNQTTKEHLDLDNRIFSCLGAGDMTRPEFREKFLRKTPEEEAEHEEYEENKEKKALVEELSYAGKSYYKSYDSPIVSMDPTVKARAKWRWRTR